MPDPFTDEDRAHIERLADTYICEATTEDVLARALSYITHLEGALEAADELEASLGPLFDALVTDEEAPCGWFPSETEQILTNNAARAYRSARAALPERRGRVSEVRDKLPPDAVINAEIQVCGYVDPDDTDGMAYAVWADCDVPLSTALGLLELAKRDLIERSEDDA